MHELMRNIVSYLDYLESSLGLSISVHFSHQKLRSFPDEMFSMLLPYNVHKNPYCAMVKKNQWEKCIQTQQNILRDEGSGKCFCHTCYAGVQDYVCQIREENHIAGYVAVSGYRNETPPPGCIDEEVWKGCLSATAIPLQMLNSVIPPLCRMFELLFRYPLEDDYQGEYNLILQFLHERHGQVTLDDLCEHFGRSKSYISHMFNEKCDMTLPAYCNSLKLNYAKTLIAKVGIPITEISMDVGYNDVSYFILRFKEKFGVTPLQYRKMVKARLENQN